MVTVTVPPGSFRISSVRIFPGRTVCPDSCTSATVVYSMERDPSEQVRLILFSSATIKTPSRICLAGLGASARVTVVRPSRKSCVFIEKIILYVLSSFGGKPLRMIIIK